MSGTDEIDSLRRARTVLVWHGLSVAALAKRCGVSLSHLRCVLLSERKPSRRLVSALCDELGADAFAFVTGQSDSWTIDARGDK